MPRQRDDENPAEQPAEEPELEGELEAHENELDAELELEAEEVDADAELERELAAPKVDEGKSIERQAREFGRVVDAFERGLRDLLGVEGDLVPVGMDGAVGFWLPGALELKTNEKYRRCSPCNGHGQVLTGSIADGKQTADCPRCSGRGYLEKLDNEQQQPDGATNGAAPVDPDAGFGVPAWMGNPALGGSSA